MSDIVRRFTHEKFGTLRWVVQEGVEMCLLQDAALLLGYVTSTGRAATSRAKRHLRDSQVKVANRDVCAELGISRGRPPLLITESGLWRLIMRSEKPDAGEIQIWVEDIVLPGIRRDGGYIDESADALQRSRLLYQINYLDVKDFVAKAKDYVPGKKSTNLAFAIMQNAFHIAVTGMDKAELIGSGRPILMWKGVNGPTKGDLNNGMNFLEDKETLQEAYLSRIIVGEVGLKVIDQGPYTMLEFVELVRKVLQDSYDKGLVKYRVPSRAFRLHC